MELLVFPVSLVLKFWHFILVGLMQMDPVQAWLSAIVLLVVTVRMALLPIAWEQKLAARRGILMRAEVAILEEKYGSSVNPRDVFALEDGKKALKEKYGYKSAQGCTAPLIQIPVMLGLYRLLTWIARPESHDSSHGIGVLSNADIESFRQAKFNGLPIQVYLAMPQERLDAFGVTRAEVHDFLFPLLLIAISFTALSMAVALFNKYVTMEWESQSARRSFKIIAALALLVPGFLLHVGMHKPIALALLIYWFLNRLWSLLQATVFLVVLMVQYPEDRAYQAKRLEDRRELSRQRTRNRRAERRIKRQRKAIRRAGSGREAWHLKKELDAYEAALAQIAEESAEKEKAIAKRQQQLRLARMIKQEQERGKHRILEGKHRPKEVPLPRHLKVLAKVAKVRRVVREKVGGVIPEQFKRQRTDVPVVPPSWRRPR